MKLERKERSDLSDLSGRRERKKTIIDFNHIDPSIPPEELEKIKKLYATYKRLWWCFKKIHQNQKRLDLAEKITSSFLVASGIVVGGATLNPLILGVISGMGLIIKTIQEARNRGKRLRKQSLLLPITKKLCPP